MDVLAVVFDVSDDFFSVVVHIEFVVAVDKDLLSSGCCKSCLSIVALLFRLVPPTLLPLPNPKNDRR